MGAINHKSSNIITLAYNVSDCETNCDDCLVCAVKKDEIDELLSIYYFGDIKVETKGGYYEGFSIQITDIISDGMTIEDIKEDITEILDAYCELEKFLHSCIDIGLSVCYPGWCTGWEHDDKTCRHLLSQAIAKRKQDWINATL